MYYYVEDVLDFVLMGRGKWDKLYKLRKKRKRRRTNKKKNCCRIDYIDFSTLWSSFLYINYTPLHFSLLHVNFPSFYHFSQTFQCYN